MLKKRINIKAAEKFSAAFWYSENHLLSRWFKRGFCFDCHSTFETKAWVRLRATACAAAAAAVENGYCLKGEDITVKTRGGDLTVRCTDDGIVLTGGTELIFTGELRY